VIYNQGEEETNTVEVETITKHELPETQWLDLKRPDRAKECETELYMTGERHGRARGVRKE